MGCAASRSCSRSSARRSAASRSSRSATSASRLRVEHIDVATIGQLGPIHGDVGLAHEFGAGDRGLVGERDSDARIDEGFLGVDRVRRAERRAHPFSQSDRLLTVAQLRAQHHELVASEPGDGVGVADGGRQAAGRLDQQLIAAGVTYRVVDHLEAVEVAEQQGHGVVGGLPCGEAIGQPAQQQASVRQAGQCVVAGLMGQLPAEASRSRARITKSRQRCRPVRVVSSNPSGSPNTSIVPVAAASSV